MEKDSHKRQPDSVETPVNVDTPASSRVQEGGIDVAYVARLARLHLTPDETARFQGQLEQIIGYVRQIETLDITGIEPTSHAVSVTNIARPDVAREGLAHESVMANAPESIDGHFRVPRIVDASS